MNNKRGETTGIKKKGCREEAGGGQPLMSDAKGKGSRLYRHDYDDDVRRPLPFAGR